jgi:predicted dehydrogenase
LRWGVLGAARIARNFFIPAAQASRETHVVAIASRDRARAQAMATDFEIDRVHDSYEALLSDPDVDAIYNPLPNSLHPRWTINAARAGKHVLCEKPVARTAADADSMAAACRQAGVLLMEAFMWRHHTQHARVRAMLDAGEIGDPRMVRGTFTYVMGAGPNVRLESSLEGGSLMDVGCYPLNAARWVFGSEPTEVSAQQVVDARFGVDTVFAAVLRFPGDRLALIDSSFAQSGQNMYEVVGTSGRIIVERAYRPDARAGRIHVLRGDDQRVEEVPPTDQFVAEVDHFAQCVRAGRLLPPAEDGTAQARVVEALYASAQTGRAVQLR